MPKNFTIERLALVTIVMLLFAIALRAPVDTDTWWHLRSAHVTLNQGMIYGDPFSHTHLGETWINHSWGSQIVLYGFYRALGDGGLMLFQALLSVGGMLLLYRVCSGSIYARGFVLLMGASVASVFWSARPQMFSFFFNALIMLIIFDAKQGARLRWWLIPPVMWIWSNLHGGWFIGYLFIGAALVGELFNHVTRSNPDERLTMPQIRQLLLGTLLSLPLLILSPYGLDNALVPFNTVSMDALREFIQEWNSPNFEETKTWTFLGTLMLLLMVLWVSHRAFDWTSWFLLIGTLFLALLYGRNIAVFAVAVTPIFSQHLNDWLRRRGWTITPRKTVSRAQARLNSLLAFVLVFAVTLYGLTILLPPTIDDARRLSLPVDAVQHLNENHYEGALFNSYNWGGYLIHHAPQYPVFIDGRTDLYGDFLRRYVMTSMAFGDWRVTFATYDIALVLIEVSTGLDFALRQDPDWYIVYEDDLAVIHRRNHQ